MQRHPAAVPVKKLAGILALGALLAACGQKEPVAPAAPAAPPAPTDQAAQVEASLAITPEALEALLAPIALYPDPVLAQVLAASTNPQMVLDAGNWLIGNPDLKGRALDEAAEPLGFSPSMRALLQFPEVVDMMCMQLDWTTQLGEAFTADQAGVLDAVQRLRKQSADVGNLKTSDQLKVETAEQEGKEVITVEPADPEVIYVPRYDPVAVYAPPPATIPPPTTTTVAQEKEGYSTGAMVTTGLLAFGAGLLVAEVFDDDDDYDNYYPNYGYGGMYYGGRPYYPPPPGAYRPPYGGAYRPANGYNRPPSYQNGFNNNTIIVNNQGNDYWNSYGRRPGAGGSQTGRPGSPISKARPNRPELQSLDQQQRTRQAQASTRPRPEAGDKSAGWQGQSSYSGARGTTGKPAQQPSGAGTAQRAAAMPPKGKVQGEYAGARPEGQAARDRMVAGRPAVPGQAKGDRGYGDTPRQAPKGTTQQRDQQRSTPDRQQQSARRPAQPGAARSGGQSGSFGGASRGSSDRAASQRGRQSMPQGARSKGSAAGRSGGGASRSGSSGGSRR
ncbi:MAG: DUF3300 domain-containing protein [Gammaproteobacteria bacterium]|nr:DUF3300 domain-containing protein [Gammaproteobacteria bacterium]